jgi:hypothetical protein
VDNKGLRSMGALLFKPGVLSKKFIEGKRRSYNRPLRIYLFISFLFFLITSIDTGDSEEQGLMDADTTMVNDTTGIKGNLNLTFNNQPLNGEESTDFEKAIQSKLDVINTPEGAKMFQREMEDTIPLFSFLLIPLLALYMYWMFWKKGRYYVDSFVYALHCQTFGFLLLTILTIIQFFIDVPFGNLLVVLISAVYFVIAAKKLYETSYIGTLLRLAAVATGHIIVSAFLVAAYLLLLLFLTV